MNYHYSPRAWATAAELSQKRADRRRARRRRNQIVIPGTVIVLGLMAIGLVLWLT